MKLYFTILILALIGFVLLLSFACTKKPDNITIFHNCQLCIELSDKYRQSDTLFLRTDTLFTGRLCDSTLNVFKLEAAKQEKIFTLCGLNLIEKRRFVYQ